ncbi:hypothetical protein niasHT_004137 [Heterodera trifolii]|uniref:Uncharacterized protein n=1 Tax=Heterodera trifolii TaxID=157864 RepID=A0ABD2LQD7_9BILA
METTNRETKALLSLTEAKLSHTKAELSQTKAGFRQKEEENDLLKRKLVELKSVPIVWTVPSPVFLLSVLPSSIPSAHQHISVSGPNDQTVGRENYGKEAEAKCRICLKHEAMTVAMAIVSIPFSLQHRPDRTERRKEQRKKEAREAEQQQAAQAQTQKAKEQRQTQQPQKPREVEQQQTPQTQQQPMDEQQQQAAQSQQQPQKSKYVPPSMRK